MHITYYLGVQYQVVTFSPKDDLCKNCYFPPLTVRAVSVAVFLSNLCIIWMLFPIKSQYVLKP